METSRIDYYNSPNSRATVVAMGIVVIALIVFVVWVGANMSWKLAAIPALFVAIAGYGTYQEVTKILDAKLPALSLLSESLIVRTGSGNMQIDYQHIQSVEIDSGRGYSYLTFRFKQNGNIDDVSLEAAGLDTPKEKIMEAITQRIPSTNNPRTGPSMLVCSPT